MLRRLILFTRFPFVSLIVMTIFSALPSHGQGSSHATLLALSKTDHILAVVDPATLKVIARIPVGEDPHEVIASTDGKFAYVSIYGGGSLHTINVIDLVARKRLADIDTRPLLGPHGLTYANGKLWFTVEGSKAVASYNANGNSIDWVMGTGQDRTHMIYVTNDGKKLYTTNVASGTVSILQDTIQVQGNGQPPPPGNRPPGSGNMPPPPRGFGPREEWRQTLLTTARGSEGFDVSPDGKELWTASSEEGKITIIDLQAKKVSIQLDANVNGANRLKFTPDGKKVFIASLQNGELTIFDAATRKEIKRLKTGNGAAGIQMDPDGSRAFVACSADNYITIVDLKTLAISGKLEIGGTPDGLAWCVQP